MNAEYRRIESPALATAPGPNLSDPITVYAASLGRATPQEIPPHYAASDVDAARVQNADIASLPQTKLVGELAETLEIVGNDPGAWVWRGPHEHITTAQWGQERIALILERLGRTRPLAPARTRKGGRSWSLRN